MLSSLFYRCRGMTVTSGSISLKKDSQNLIGISIGGGAPLCPCLYVVQVNAHTSIPELFFTKERFLYPIYDKFFES